LNKTTHPDNCIRRLDARTKMTICLLSSLVVIVLKGVVPLSFLLAASLVYVLFQKRFGVLLICYGAVTLMGLMALFCIRIMVVFIPEMGQFDLSMFFVPFLRVVILLNVILALALSSKIQDILTSL